LPPKTLFAELATASKVSAKSLF